MTNLSDFVECSVWQLLASHIVLPFFPASPDPPSFPPASSLPPSLRPSLTTGLVSAALWLSWVFTSVW